MKSAGARWAHSEIVTAGTSGEERMPARSKTSSEATRTATAPSFTMS